MESSGSVPRLFDELVDLHLCRRRVTQNQREARTTRKRKLKSKSFATLFSFLNSKDQRWKSPLSVVDRLYSVAFDLRQKRCFDEANRLESCIKSMQSSFSKDDLSTYGTLLLTLHSPSAKNSNSGGCLIPVVHAEKHSLAVLPPKNFHFYGDTQMYTQRYGWFEYFSGSTFELDEFPLKQNEGVLLPDDTNAFSIFHQIPGSSMSGPGFFSNQDEEDCVYKQRMKRGLFGGLVQGEVHSVNERLDLPDLRANTALCPSPFIKSTDEGYAASITGSSGSVASNSEGYATDDDPFELALNYKPSLHYTWETVGQMPRVLERPFITESEPAVFDLFYASYMQNLLLIEPKRFQPEPIEISATSFILDIVNVLIAAPSQSFYFDVDRRCFRLFPGIFVTGLSLDSISAYSEEFLSCGNLYCSLMEFSEAPSLDSFNSGGLVKQAFQEGVRRYLQYYRACILSLKPNLTLLGLSLQLKGIVAQMRYLGRLCKCHSEESFPTGVQLLSYLHAVAIDSVSSPHHGVMLFLFRKSCQPYLRFLEDWVFYGTFNDAYKEFMIEINPIYLNYRDKMFWTRAFVMSLNADGSSAVPVFLADLANSIYVCGKSINLLKLCQQNHYLFTKRQNVPRLDVCFTEEELVAMETECSVYISKVKALGHQQMQLREERKAAAAAARRELIQKVRVTAALETSRLEAETAEKRRKRSLKKKQLLEEIKQQIESNAQRRTTAKEQDKEAEKVRLQDADKQELLEAAVNDELERQTRDNLIAYYEKLTEEAALRERRALWRVERSRLREKREELLRDEEEKWAKELKDKEIVLEAVTPAEDVLPQWAKRGLAEIEESDKAFESLPKWAQRGIANAREIQTDDEQHVLRPRLTPPKMPLRLRETSAGPVKKALVKFVEEKRVSAETEQTRDAKSSVKIDDPSMITASSEEMKTRAHVKMVSQKSATEESVETEDRACVQMVSGRNISEETEQVAAKRLAKAVADQHVGRQSQEQEKRLAIRTVDGEGSSRESEQVALKVYKPSVHGHASDVSSQEERHLPKLKRIDGRHATAETMDAPQVKPHRLKRNSELDANQESEEKVVRCSIRVNADQYASKESEIIDQDEVRLERFRQRHPESLSAKSTVQRLLYGAGFGHLSPTKDESEAPPLTTDVKFWTDVEQEPYSANFNFAILPEVDLLHGPFTEYSDSPRKRDDPAPSYISLGSALSQAITRPLTAQIELVNSCLLGYFQDQLSVDGHLEALRCYLFMQDGEFSHLLSLELFNKLCAKPNPSEIFNPLFLTNCLNKAITYSLKSNSDKVDNLSFSLKFLPTVLNHNAYDALDCLILSYKVNWPLNIVITEACLSKYNQVFTFLLHLKRAVWTLENVCHNLKRAALIRRRLSNSGQLRTLHLYRHKMQHFAKVIQGYIANQVIHVSWQEFQERLRSVQSVDDLHTEHVVYLNKALSRCLLNKQAQPVMNIIQHIFNLILKFHSQLTSASWEEECKEMVHPAFDLLCNTFKSFNEYSNFLFIVLSKLAMRGYQPHLRDLLLQLDFNGYHAKSAAKT